MTDFRNNLPQLGSDVFLTDGGLETTLMFQNSFELPYFAAFDLLKSKHGRAALRDYFESYIAIAHKYGVGIVLESATWRANADWGAKLHYSAVDLSGINRQAMELMHDLRKDVYNRKTKIVISGCIGPRGDGYHSDSLMTIDEAENYHRDQIEAFYDSPADLVSALTMTNCEEAIGIARAAKSVSIPVVISFTVETDGNLPSGQSLEDAITTVEMATDHTPEYYMINCAHPTHFNSILGDAPAWTDRIRGIRANASVKSHVELDEADTLDDGNPVELAQQFAQLRNKLKRLTVLGGCCGTDQRHIEEISKACLH